LVPFAEYCARVQAYLEDAYGMSVVTRDIPDPLTGDLDGATIHVDYLLPAEDRLFLLVHLFGHTAQWNLSPEGYELGQPQVPPLDDILLPRLMAYEQEAAAYGLSLLHAVGIHDLDQWFSDFAACDVAYLENYYVTGVKGNFRDFWKDHTPLITPCAVPSFQLTRRPPRADGIVI
jgi:hypothetical protein